MSTLAIVQARWGSTRFPGKVLEDLCGHPVLAHVVKRAQAAIQDIVVAVPNAPKDARVASCCTEKLRVPVYWYDGAEDDVLGRFVACAREHKADTIIRLTADCPLLDPEWVGAVVALQAITDTPYVASTAAGGQVDGLDVEVFSRELLDRADAATPDVGREHVTTWMRTTEPRILLKRRLPLPGTRQHRWTVDTPEDLDWLRMIGGLIDLTPPRNVAWDLAALLSRRPGLARYTA